MENRGTASDIRPSDLTREVTRLSNEELCQIITAAFGTLGHQATSEAVSDDLPEVFKLTVDDREILVCAKGITKGGASRPDDELRIQQLPKFSNYCYEHQEEVYAAVQLGVYKYNNAVILAAWKLSSSASTSYISKQIKLGTIQRAWADGFSQQARGTEFVCAFRPEFIHFYINCYPLLHANDTFSHGNVNDGIIPTVVADVDREQAYRSWLTNYVRDNGEHYSPNTIAQYVGALRWVSEEFVTELAPYTSIYEIQNSAIYDPIASSVRSAERYESFNQSRGNGAISASLTLYGVFLRNITVIPTERDVVPISYETGLISHYPRNRILFGAPGTGKSYTLNHEKDLLLADGGEYERATFHPDYSYANFVGTYKPVPCKDSDGKDAITYSYVPGPFMRTYVKALKNSRTDTPKPFLLVIEEINRANVAAVFGDVFQLLDRGDDEVSEYPIQASEDIKKYLAGELGGNPDNYAEIRIPDNMFIWATMNSADQGVFPMDTAFKRRWDFTYLGIDDSEAGIVGKKVILGQGEYRRIVEWNALRKAINNELLTYKVNEDKLMGPNFISKKNLPEGEMIDLAVFTRIFKNKVIMYLFDDAAKQKRITLFGGCDEKAKNQYSKICREFDIKGVYIFCEGISNQFIDNVPEDDGE